MGRPVGTKLIAKKTEAERKQARKDICLADAGLTATTQARYSTALFLLLPVLEALQTPEALDMAVSDWIEWMFSKGEPQHLISDALCGLQWWEPWTKRRLPNAWRLFHVWRKIEVVARAPPLTSLLVRSMVAYCLAHSDIQMAAALLIGFYGLLRTGEILNLRLSECLIKGSHCILSLADTKSGKRKGTTEMVHLSDPLTLEVLRTLKEIRVAQNCPASLVWTNTADQFRRRFNHYCQKFGLQQHQFRPYSLRRGGATHVFQQTRSMEYTLMLGRWESTRVARCYISDALSFLPKMTLSHHTTQMMHQFPNPLPEVLEQP